MQGGQVAVRALVVTRRDPPPGFQAVDTAFGDVALLVQLGVEVRWAPARGALLAAGGGLVLLDRDDRGDLAAAQVGTVRLRAVRLIGGDRARAGARAQRPGPVDDQLVEYGDELRAVVGLARGQQQAQWAAAGLGGQMDLAGQPAAGASELREGRTGLAPAPADAALCTTRLLSRRFGAAARIS